ncbi:MAG: hypothetical protein ABEJ31_08985 [Haloarculaceae archaeon]
MQSRDDRHPRVSPLSADHPPDRIRSMHDVFGDPSRRAVLYYLQEIESPADVCAVARQVAAWCRDRADAAGVRRERAWLLHSHVLSLAEAGLVTYDAETDTIALPDDVCIAVDPPEACGGSANPRRARGE